jgi:hypothetical protein
MWWSADARAGPGFEPAICRVMNACCYPSSLPASGSVFSLPVVFTLTLVLLNKQTQSCLSSKLYEAARAGTS